MLENYATKIHTTTHTMSSTLTAPRKLTPTETATLRSRLRNELVVKGPQDEEDAGDLLDYAFAMIANGKDVAYVVEEVSCSRRVGCHCPVEAPPPTLHLTSPACIHRQYPADQHGNGGLRRPLRQKTGRRSRRLLFRFDRENPTQARLVSVQCARCVGRARIVARTSCDAAAAVGGGAIVARCGVGTIEEAGCGGRGEREERRAASSSSASCCCYGDDVANGWWN